MAEIYDMAATSPGQQGNRGTQTLLRGQAFYSPDLPRHDDEATPNIDETGTRHEVEVKIDQNGLVRMDIFMPRTLVNSIPLRGGPMPMGPLENFEVQPSNSRGNVLCIMHQTSQGRPKHEYLIFTRREEMNQWQEKLTNAVLANPNKRRTDPTPFNLQPEFQEPRATSAVNPGCFSNLLSLSEPEHASSDDDVTQNGNRVDDVNETDVDLSPNKTPVEDTYPFGSYEDGDGGQASGGDDSYVGLPSIAELAIAPGVEVPRLRVSPTSSDEGWTHLQVPTEQTEQTRSPSISTVNTAGEMSQRARGRLDNTRTIRDIFSHLRQETQTHELTVEISVREACLLKTFEHQGHTWVRNCCGTPRLYAGDLINTVNGEKVTSTQMFRDRIEAMSADNQVVQLTIGRLQEASLLMMRALPSGEVPFTTEGTKIKSIDVEADEGLFRVAKCGNAYITNINGRFIPYGSTTAEVFAHLQNAGEEFFLVLHSKNFAEKLR